MITHLSRTLLHKAKAVTYLTYQDPSSLLSRQFLNFASRRLFHQCNNIWNPIKANDSLSSLRLNGKTLESPIRTLTSQEQKLQDPVSLKDEGIIVYEGPLRKQIVLVKVFSLSTSVLGAIIQPIMVTKALAYGSVFAIAIGSFIGIYAFATPVILHWIVKRKQNTVFSADDVRIPEVPGPFTSFTAKGKAFLVAPAFFSDRNVYAHLMGYDKPLNLELKTDKPKETDSEKL